MLLLLTVASRVSCKLVIRCWALNFVLVLLLALSTKADRKNTAILLE